MIKSELTYAPASLEVISEQQAHKAVIVDFKCGANVSEEYQGRCLCGAVRFTARGNPKWVLWCHCESCRRHSGAPASVFVSFENDAVEITSGEIAMYESSPGVERGFCAHCGSTMTCSNPRWPTEKHFHIGLFARAAELAPAAHFFKNERLPWMHTAGD